MSTAVWVDGVAGEQEAAEGNLEPGFLQHLAEHGVLEGFAVVDSTAGQQMVDRGARSDDERARLGLPV